MEERKYFHFVGAVKNARKPKNRSVRGRCSLTENDDRSVRLVGQSVGLSRSRAVQNGSTDRDAVSVVDSSVVN